MNCYFVQRHTKECHEREMENSQKEQEKRFEAEREKINKLEEENKRLKEEMKPSVAPKPKPVPPSKPSKVCYKLQTAKQNNSELNAKLLFNKTFLYLLGPI